MDPSRPRSPGSPSCHPPPTIMVGPTPTGGRRVNAIVVYESLTGNTRRAASRIGADLTASGVPTSVCPITEIDYPALAAADVVVIGTWTDGLFVVGQRPGRAIRMAKL